MKTTFTRYQVFVVAVLAFLQFTIVLDFMIMSPLGVMVLDSLAITPAQFGFVVSAYAFSAGAAGIAAAGFADRFDRKKMLLVFYTGFVIGTLFCGLAPTYTSLVVARMVTGLFGGVMSSISFAIIADLFPLETRGRVMGFVMTAFAGSQVLGIPIGIYMAEGWDWHAPFLMIAGIAGIVGLVIFLGLRPITGHLDPASDERRPIAHLIRTATTPRYLNGFAATTLLATGGFMLMPFASAFAVHNLGIDLKTLPIVYITTGVTSIIAGPLLGRLSDAVGKYAMFLAGSVVALFGVIFYTHLGLTPLWLVLIVNSVLFAAITARMISANALITAVPALPDRGAFMAINSSVQQLSGGIASVVAGLIVVQTQTGLIEGYGELGFVVAGAIAITLLLVYRIHRMIPERTS